MGAVKARRLPACTDGQGGLDGRNESLRRYASCVVVEF